MEQAGELPRALTYQDQGADHLDPPPGGAGAGGQAGQEEHEEGDEDGPQGVVGADEAAVGSDGDQVETDMAERRPEALVGPHAPEVGGAAQHAQDDDGQDTPGLGVAPVGPQAALAPGSKVGGEVERRDHHEDTQDHLDGHGVEGPDTGVAGGEAAQTERREGVADGIEPAHPGQLEGQDAGDGDAQIHGPEDGRGVADAGGEFGVLDGSRDLGAQELHAADPQQGQDGHRQDDDPHAPQPVEGMAPEVDGWLRRIEPRHHRGPGGGEPGHGLEEGVREGHVLVQHQGHRGDGRGQGPGQGDQDEAVAGLELGPVAAGGHYQHQADGDAGEHAVEEGQQGSVPEVHGAGDGHQVGQAEDHQQPTHDLDDGEQGAHLEEGQADLKEPLGLGHQVLADEEQDHMVLGLDQGVVVGHQDAALVGPTRLRAWPADYGAHRHAVGQGQFFDAPPDRLGGLAVAVDHHLQGLRCPAAQAVHRRHIALADPRQQGADGDLGRGDGDVDAVGLHQIHIDPAVDQGQHAMRPQPLGQQGAEDVVLVVVGQGKEEVHVLDPLGRQEVFVRRIAHQDQGVGQTHPQGLGAGLVGLDDLDLVAPLGGGGQSCPDVSTPGDQDALGGAVEPAQLAQDLADVAGGRQAKDLVAGLHQGLAVRDYGLVFAVDGGDAGVQVRDMAAQVGDGVSHQGPALEGAHRHQAHQAVGELQDLQGLGEFDELDNIIGDDLLRADAEVHREVLGPQQFRVLGIVRRAQPGDLGGDVEKGLGGAAGAEVGLIALGDGDEQVRVLGPGLLEHRGQGGVAHHHPQVQAVRQPRQARDIGIDDGDLVGLGDQALGHRGADLTGAQDDDLHWGQWALKTGRKREGKYHNASRAVRIPGLPARSDSQCRRESFFIGTRHRIEFPV